MVDRMPCGHPRDALVWDDDIKKEVCGACRAEAASTSYIAKAFAAREQEQSEDITVELLRKQITTWRAMNLSDPTRGLDELMGVVKQVYERDLVQMESVEFLKQFRKYSEVQSDEDKFKRVDEAKTKSYVDNHPWLNEYTTKQRLMANNRLTVNQVNILLHSLGHPKYYRNYFAASGGTQDWSDIQVLVMAGFMEEYRSRDSDSGLQYYRVTGPGKERMREAGYTLIPPENKRELLDED